MLSVLTSCMAGRNNNLAPDAPSNGQQGAENNFGNVIVTIKQAEDGTVFFQLSDTERLYPGPGYPFERQCRAMGDVSFPGGSDPVYGRNVSVGWLEPLEEGTFMPYPAEVSGEDGIDIITGSWITSCEDGYLTLHYRTWWGEHPTHHIFSLVQGEDPYELTLRHNSNEDARDIYSEGIIYFDINSLPRTEDGPHALKLNWINSSGTAVSAEFEFESRT